MAMAMAMAVTIMTVVAVVAVGVGGMLDPLDFLTLQRIRKSMEDMPGSAYFEAWDFSTDPCGFPGVVCEQRANAQRVVALNLGDTSAGVAGLRGSIDGSIGCLTELVELTIVPGEVRGPIPETLGQCRELQFLGISYNLISGRVPDCVGQLLKLQTLDLSFNKLIGPLPPQLSRLPSLSNLMLSHNHIAGSIPSLDSTQLVRADFKHNRLTGPLPPLPPTLEYLSVSFNALSGGIDAVAGLRGATYLDLSSNHFAGTIPEAVFSLPLLSTLHLQRNFLSGRVTAPAPVSIAEVDLSFNLLTGSIPSELSYSTTLFLNNNHFVGPLPTVFTDRLLAGHIQTLYLQHNFLTDITLSPSTALPLKAAICIQYNCFSSSPSVHFPCPFKAGNNAIRPTYQCNLTAS